MKVFVVKIQEWTVLLTVSTLRMQSSFFGRHDVNWRSCISMVRSIHIITQAYSESIYFSAQHILGPANNSSWAGHTEVILWAIRANPKSWANL